jgi:hypothetical protein
MSTLQRAIEIALDAHRGQVDKAGAMYILHPLRVMLSLPTEEERIAGILHDVVEDCPGWSLDRLVGEGFSSEIVDAINSVTKRAGEDYFAFIDRAAGNKIGRGVKIADLRDNMSPDDRMLNPTNDDHARIVRYHVALTRLLEVA